MSFVPFLGVSHAFVAIVRGYSLFCFCASVYACLLSGQVSGLGGLGCEVAQALHQGMFLKSDRHARFHSEDPYTEDFGRI